MEDLIDFFKRYVRGPKEALVYDDGFRRWSYSGDDVRATAEAFADRLADAGLRTGDRLLIWGDNRPEWVAAFWGCTLCGVAVIPLDAAASPELVGRIIKVAAPHSILIGDGLQVGQLPPSMCVWRLRDIRWINASATPALHNRAGTRADFSRARVGPHTVAEIVFTSGTTGEPKGVVLTLATSSRTSRPSSARSGRSAVISGCFGRFDSSAWCLSVTCSARRWRSSFHPSSTPRPCS